MRNFRRVKYKLAYLAPTLTYKRSSVLDLELELAKREEEREIGRNREKGWDKEEEEQRFASRKQQQSKN